VTVKITDVSGFESAVVMVFAEMPAQNQWPVNSAVGSGNIKNNALEVLLTIPKNNTTVTDTP
jgi:hypothetical protein